MSLVHILRVSDAKTYRVNGPETYNKKAKRSYCSKCRQLKDTTTLYARLAGPPEPTGPDSEHDFYYYYEPNWSWCCADCAEKHGWIEWQKENPR